MYIFITSFCLILHAHKPVCNESFFFFCQLKSFYKPNLYQNYPLQQSLTPLITIKLLFNICSILFVTPCWLYMNTTIFSCSGVHYKTLLNDFISSTSNLRKSILTNSETSDKMLKNQFFFWQTLNNWYIQTVHKSIS